MFSSGNHQGTRAGSTGSSYALDGTLKASLLFYGPDEALLRACLRLLHDRLKPSQRGEILALPVIEAPGMTFDTLPLHVTDRQGETVELLLVAVPQLAAALETRLQLWKKASGVVFIAPSQACWLEESIDRLADMQGEMQHWGLDPRTFPVAFHYRDRTALEELPGLLQSVSAMPQDSSATEHLEDTLTHHMSRESLDQMLNQEQRPSFCNSPGHNDGFRLAFRTVCNLAIQQVRMIQIALRSDSTLDPALHPRALLSRQSWESSFDPLPPWVGISRTGPPALESRWHVEVSSIHHEFSGGELRNGSLPAPPARTPHPPLHP